MNLKEARLFVARFVSGDHSPEEYAAFLRWLEEASADDLNVIADEHEALQGQWSLTEAGPSSEWIAQLEHKLDRADEQKERAIIRKIGAGRNFKWIAAAAAVFAIMAGGSYWYSQRSSEVGSGAETSKKPVEVLSKLYVTQKGENLRQFTLADGSKVWLNAASTLKYGASFNQNERNVELSGEAYFEVAKNAEKPFRVKIRDANIEVLGTEFNVMAYPDEPVSRTTLVSGSVKVARGTEEIELKQGDQAEIGYTPSGVSTPIKLVNGVKLNSVTSWKNGYIDFENADLRMVMRELGRSYNYEVRYEAGIPEKRITGSFSRKDDINQILKQLEEVLNINIHFKIEGKTITVS